MKAVIFPKYGSPDVLQVVDIDKPSPNEHQILVKVHATATNPLDWHRMRGEPIIARMGEGYRVPKNPKLGADIAGVVEAVGSSVTEFKVGDEVFGSIGSGGFAEYVCAREKFFAHKPRNLSFEEAAAAPVVGFTALQGLRDTGQIQAGQKVLVNGASGGVGTFAVQIAKSYGAEVTGVCSTGNVEMVRSIGADHVIDYKKDDFTKNGQAYDLVYDAIGNRSVMDYRRALSPQGKCVIAGFTSFKGLIGHLILGKLLSKKDGKQVLFMGMAKVDKDDLLLLGDMLEQGKIRPVIDRCYPFEETAEALRYLETGRAKGKVIVTLA